MEKNQCLESLHCSSFLDERGSLNTFREVFQTILPFNFVDCYIAKSSKGVFRGLHLQLSDKLPLKYIKAITGKIVLISLCLDIEHAKYCNVWKFFIDSKDEIAVVIQPKHAIGYFVQSEYAEVFIGSSVSYQGDQELGVNVLTISELSELTEGAILSEKDLNLPTIDEVLILINAKFPKTS